MQLLRSFHHSSSSQSSIPSFHCLITLLVLLFFHLPFNYAAKGADISQSIRHSSNPSIRADASSHNTNNDPTSLDVDLVGDKAAELPNADGYEDENIPFDDQSDPMLNNDANQQHHLTSKGEEESENEESNAPKLSDINESAEQEEDPNDSFFNPSTLNEDPTFDSNVDQNSNSEEVEEMADEPVQEDQQVLSPQSPPTSASKKILTVENPSQQSSQSSTPTKLSKDAGSKKASSSKTVKVKDVGLLGDEQDAPSSQVEKGNGGAGAVKDVGKPSKSGGSLKTVSEKVPSKSKTATAKYASKNVGDGKGSVDFLGDNEDVPLAEKTATKESAKKSVSSNSPTRRSQHRQYPINYNNQPNGVDYDYEEKPSVSMQQPPKKSYNPPNPDFEDQDDRQYGSQPAVYPQQQLQYNKEEKKYGSENNYENGGGYEGNGYGPQNNYNKYENGHGNIKYEGAQHHVVGSYRPPYSYKHQDYDTHYCSVHGSFSLAMSGGGDYNNKYEGEKAGSSGGYSSSGYDQGGYYKPRQYTRQYCRYAAVASQKACRFCCRVVARSSNTSPDDIVSAIFAFNPVNPASNGAGFSNSADYNKNRDYSSSTTSEKSKYGDGNNKDAYGNGGTDGAYQLAYQCVCCAPKHGHQPQQRKSYGYGGGKY